MFHNMFMIMMNLIENMKIYFFFLNSCFAFYFKIDIIKKKSNQKLSSFCRHIFFKNALEMSNSSTSGIFCEDSNGKGIEINYLLDSANWQSTSSDTDTEFYLPKPRNLTYGNREYVHQLESELRCTQKAFMSLSTQLTRFKFQLRQIFKADAVDRDNLLQQLQAYVGTSDEDDGKTTDVRVGTIKPYVLRQRQNDIMQKLSEQVDKLSISSQQKYCVPRKLVKKQMSIKAAKEKLFKNVHEKQIKLANEAAAKPTEERNV